MITRYYHNNDIHMNLQECYAMQQQIVNVLKMDKVEDKQYR